MKTLITTIAKAIVPPVLTRIGTVLATVLLTAGFPTELIEQFITASGAIVLVGIDIINSKAVKGGK